MSTLIIEGGTPLVGNVTVSGSRNSALKLIYAAMFCNEDVVLENVPNVNVIEEDLAIARSVGGRAEWLGENRLILSGRDINTYEIPEQLGSRYRTTLLLAGPLMFRFGKALIPKFKPVFSNVHPTNRFFDTWKTLGVEIIETKDAYFLDASAIKSANIHFKTTTHMGTDNAILTSILLPGETVISNASEETEIEDLIELCNLIGAEVVRLEPRKISVKGAPLFKAAKFSVQPDRTEAAIFATLAVCTKGNITIQKIDRTSLIPFVNFLNKVGVRFEFSGSSLKVWWQGDLLLIPQKLVVSPTPGFIPDWQPLAALILSQITGESQIHETVNVERFGYIKDLNIMGAKLTTIKATEEGLIPIISDDSYSFDKEGEPEILLKINGPVKLNGTRINIENFLYGPIFVLAALCALGKSEISGFDRVERYMENFYSKLLNLGAKIWKMQV